METALQIVTVVYPTLEQIISLVVNSVECQESKRVYRRNLREFLTWYANKGKPELNAALVKSYKAELVNNGVGDASINLRLVAVRALAREAVDSCLLDERLLAGIQRVRGIHISGHRLGNWLSKGQAETLINAPDTTFLKGKRDRAALAVLVGCGLRRDECSRLTFDQVQQREGRWVIVDLVGKGNKTRSVPMPPWAKTALDNWSQSSGCSSGRIFRHVNKGGCVMGEGMTSQAIRNLVVEYGEAVGIGIAPHDCRRTFAKLAHKGGADLRQIQLSLGHASLTTTERYLGIEQDLQAAPCDFLGLRP